VPNITLRLFRLIVSVNLKNYL